MSQQEQIEHMVLTCIDTAKAMLKEYQIIMPFGIRSYADSEDLKMNCPGDKKPEASWNEQIEMVIAELKEFIINEDISATALVTELESEGETGIGLQIETELSSVLFVYPYKKEGEEWVIDEPIQTDQLLATVFPRNAD